jgi:hypothetical protein
MQDEEVADERRSHCQRHEQETSLARANEPREVPTAVEEKDRSEQSVDR